MSASVGHHQPCGRQELHWAVLFRSSLASATSHTWWVGAGNSCDTLSHTTSWSARLVIFHLDCQDFLVLVSALPLETAEVVHLLLCREAEAEAERQERLRELKELEELEMQRQVRDRKSVV